MYVFYYHSVLIQLVNKTL